MNKYSQQEEFKHQTYNTHCEQDVLLMMKTFQTAGRSGSVSSSQVRRGIKNEEGKKDKRRDKTQQLYLNLKCFHIFLLLDLSSDQHFSSGVETSELITQVVS